MNTKYLLAKFAPDLRRMEPRNIGVIAWSNGQTHARFLGDKVAIPKRLEVKDRANYSDWIESWKRQLNKPDLELDDGRTISPSSSEYLESLTEWSSGNFMLVVGGETVLEKNETLRSHTLALFNTLVDVPSKEDSEKKKLTAKAKYAIELAGIDKEIGYQPNFPSWYEPLGLKRSIEFDFGVGPIKLPNSIYQRIYLQNQPAFERTVNNLHWFIKSRRFKKKACASMILMPSNATPQVKENLEMLGQVSEIVPVNDTEEASQRLLEVAAAGQ